MSAGGNGHSLTNTIWYYATRPKCDPIELPHTPSPTPASYTTEIIPGPTPHFDCGCPETCTEEALDYPAGHYTCGERIYWLMKSAGKSEHDACSRVSGVEFTNICAGCDPNRCVAPKVSPKQESTVCPACSKEVCENGQLNKCPVLSAPFLCTSGVNEGGCSMVPWKLHTFGGSNCNTCCQLTYGCQ